MRTSKLVVPLLLMTVSLAGCSRAPEGGSLSFSTRLAAALRARFTNGTRELQRSFAAKQSARSWRMKTVMRLHPGDPLITLSEVSCPDHQRLSAKLGERPMYESVRIGDAAYIKEKDTWNKETISREYYPCGENVGAPAPWAMLNEGRDMSAALAKLTSMANPTVKVGQFIQLDGVPCQQWEVEFGHPGQKRPGGAKTMNYTVCIDASTHLPHQIIMGTGGIVVTYYDWNQPVDVNAPL